MGFRQQLVEATGEVMALCDEPLQFAATQVDMAGSGVVAPRLLAHVKDFEGEDGQAVDHGARRFAGQARRVGQFDAGQLGQQRLVERLDRVVALLVVAVDQALAGGDVGAVDVHPARLVFLIPQQAIKAVISGNELPRATARVVLFHAGPAGAPQCVIVKFDKRQRIDMREHGTSPEWLQAALQRTQVGARGCSGSSREPCMLRSRARSICPFGEIAN